MRILLFFMLTLGVNAHAACPEWWVTWPHNDSIYPRDSAPSGAQKLPTRADGSCVELVDLAFVGGVIIEDTAKRDARLAREAMEAKSKADLKSARESLLRNIDSANSVAQLRAVLKALIEERKIQ